MLDRVDLQMELNAVVEAVDSVLDGFGTIAKTRGIAPAQVLTSKGELALLEPLRIKTDALTALVKLELSE